MSKRKIVSALKRKNIPFVRVEYVRGCPTPSGYANGWDIEISEATEDRLFEAGFSNISTVNEIDTTEEALKWICSMPNLVLIKQNVDSVK
ncbi:MULTISPECIES: hypothetical protein [unclassified Pseudoalteromonas]|jgi:hypothetical protein|uniref:hypothetical protein n=1 Tax=unclassified Pseudoalteromonas TaxID=194690 RepID=UPI0002F36AA8|nr:MULTISPECIES: hypothetical protein [unclassified Pseudoalteromonas]MCC9659274.1 hypothetical protein [Pseudoalteromonas sp. MB41]RZD22369.1 hypothetical protein EVU92_10015 [Pseudoalteromonas sp. MEBiC 03485]|tara:strand:- start:344 stop:613 length:270 start_codon:yes stop_codon:yes gene_type:complete